MRFRCNMCCVLCHNQGSRGKGKEKIGVKNSSIAIHSNNLLPILHNSTGSTTATLQSTLAAIRQ